MAPATKVSARLRIVLTAGWKRQKDPQERNSPFRQVRVNPSENPMMPSIRTGLQPQA
jgi:hypothetical protein